MEKDIFAKNLNRIRKEKGFTIKRLERVCGGDINRYCRGERTPKLDTACSIADKLGVSLDELCGRKPQTVAEAIRSLINLCDVLGWSLADIANADPNGAVGSILIKYCEREKGIEDMLRMGGDFAKKAQEMDSPKKWLEKRCKELGDAPISSQRAENDVETENPF